MKTGSIFIILLSLLLFTGRAFAVGGSEVQISATRPGAVVSVERVIDDGKVLISVTDAANNTILGLTGGDFAVTAAGRTAKIVSVQPVSESLDVPRNIVLVLDNSFSMRQRKAVGPLKAGVDELLKTIRPIDKVQLVIFGDKQKTSLGGRNLNIQTFTSNKPAELKKYLDEAYGDGITMRTMLYDAMLVGLDLISKMPPDEPRFMVVFSDGEDINSSNSINAVIKAMETTTGFDAYAIDYMPETGVNPLLRQFSEEHHGKVWKAESESNFVQIFQGVASRMEHYYVLSYAFPATGSLTVAPASLTIEEIRTIDASPMLGQIFFAKDSSDLPDQYARLGGPGETAAFNEHGFRDTLEKYYQVLNIIGKRMADHPEAAITLTGCNANTGPEKGNRRLSTARAEAVRDYLQKVWGIAPERIRIEARNLPKMPSTSRLEEGQAENRRVEITSDDPALLDLIKSTYLATRIDASTLTLRPVVDAPHGIGHWTVVAANSKEKLGELAGEGPPAEEISMPLNTDNLNEMAADGDINVSMKVKDNKGQELAMVAGPVKVNFIRTSERMAKKQGVRVQEKYALILFDFDSDAIDARNREIVNSIVARMKELPQATVEIVGHTDNIGKEDYNIKLSERRALAVYKLLTAAYGEEPGDHIRHKGVGPNEPLYDNSTPEARAFNRTVTITLEYTAGD